MLITIRAYKSFKRMSSIRLLVQCHPLILFDVLTRLRWELQDFFKGSKGQGVGPMHIPRGRSRGRVQGVRTPLP